MLKNIPIVLVAMHTPEIWLWGIGMQQMQDAWGGWFKDGEGRIGKETTAQMMKASWWRERKGRERGREKSSIYLCIRHPMLKDRKQRKRERLIGRVEHIIQRKWQQFWQYQQHLSILGSDIRWGWVGYGYSYLLYYDLGSDEVTAR